MTRPREFADDLKERKRRVGIHWFENITNRGHINYIVRSECGLREPNLILLEGKFGNQCIDLLETAAHRFRYPEEKEIYMKPSCDFLLLGVYIKDEYIPINKIHRT